MGRRKENDIDARVLVQPEMERGRSPLVSNSTLRVGIFKASIQPPVYPLAWLRPRRARFRVARHLKLPTLHAFHGNVGFLILTKDELIHALQNEVRILLHLISKVDP